MGRIPGVRRGCSGVVPAASALLACKAARFPARRAGQNGADRLRWGADCGIATFRMLARGLARRCAVCGQAGLFTHWFTMVERCPRCGLRFERIEGHWLGALGLNTIVSFAALFVVVVAGLVLSHPDYAMVPLAGAAGATAVLVPLAFFPSSKTLWTAIDLLMRPLAPGEAAPAAELGGTE